jgi:hypothetical protein
MSNKGLPCESAAAVHAGAAVDLQGPVVEEAALLAAPVLGVRNRLAALLEEWPEHPILAQLTAICDRLLGERCTAPEHSVASGNMGSLYGSEQSLLVWQDRIIVKRPAAVTDQLLGDPCPVCLYR